MFNRKRKMPATGKTPATTKEIIHIAQATAPDVRMNDYVIIRFPDGKRFVTDLFRVIKIGNSPLFQQVSERKALDGMEAISTVFTLSIDDLGVELLANLGSTLPRLNMDCFGVKMRAITGHEHVDGWSNLFWMLPDAYKTSPIKGEITDLLSDCGQKLKDYQLDGLMPFQTHIVEFLDGQKHLGLYSKFHKLPFDTITLFANMKANVGGITDLTVYHEYAHGIWHYCLPDDIKVDWMKSYFEANGLDYVSPEDMLLYSKEFASASSIRDFKRDNKDNKKAAVALQSILQRLNAVYQLKSREVDILLRSGEDIYEMLTENGTTLSVIRTPDTKVSPNADRNAVELWCEAFAMYCGEQDLPKHTERLVEKTFDVIQPRQMDNNDD